MASGNRSGRRKTGSNGDDFGTGGLVALASDLEDGDAGSSNGSTAINSGLFTPGGSDGASETGKKRKKGAGGGGPALRAKNNAARAIGLLDTNLRIIYGTDGTLTSDEERLLTPPLESWVGRHEEMVTQFLDKSDGFQIIVILISIFLTRLELPITAMRFFQKKEAAIDYSTGNVFDGAVL